MTQIQYNPDVLTCLANLSNDEVFTPPKLVNDILNLLPQELWSNPHITFLDPVSKSGVFLREIAKRLMIGLESQIPDKQDRANHIFSKQLYGIAITELTGLLSRRSVYGSKIANGKYSFCDTFTNEQGNIIFNRIQHTWEKDKCTFCNASKEVYDRKNELETYAYQFIHTINPEQIFNMKFDVIIGNPPYQLSDGGAGASATPLYHKFIQQAKQLNPTYLSMIIPARWYAGGKGLDDFRAEMLNDKRMHTLVDYPKSSECFPGVEIKGGICYFLWDKNHYGQCTVITKRNEKISKINRPLLEKGFELFIRFNEAIPIIHKILKLQEKKFSDIVSSRKPFGFSTDFKGTDEQFEESTKIYANQHIGFIHKNEILQNQQWIKDYKVYITRAYGAGEDYPHQILNKPILGDVESCCTETYLLIGPFSDKKTSENVISYIQTQFFRFLVLLIKNTQDAPKKVYSFVPMQDFNESWTDEKLYKKYGLTAEEIAFIESMVRPMDLAK